MKIFYRLFSALTYLAWLTFEMGCRWHDHKARHAAPRPPAVRASGRHTAAGVRAERDRIIHRFGTAPEVAT